MRLTRDSRFSILDSRFPRFLKRAGRSREIRGLKRSLGASPQESAFLDSRLPDSLNRGLGRLRLRIRVVQAPRFVLGPGFSAGRESFLRIRAIENRKSRIENPPNSPRIQADAVRSAWEPRGSGSLPPAPEPGPSPSSRARRRRRGSSGTRGGDTR